MIEAMPRFMDPDFQKSETFLSASDEQRSFVQRLAQDGVATIQLQVADFDRIAHEITSQTAALLPGNGRLQDAWRRLPGVRAIATNSHVMQLLEFAYGRRAVPFQTLNFTVGTQQATHSDTIHFDSFPKNFMCGVWVAYEDTDAENGALHYVPGSHRLRAMAPEDFGVRGSNYWNRRKVYEQYEVALAKYIEDSRMERVAIPLKKGQALVWTANLFHGGEPIRDQSRTRHSQVTHYYFEDCLYFSPLWSNLHASKVTYKKVFDISSDKYVAPIYSGAKFRLPLSAHLREFVLAKVIGVRKS